MSGVELLSVLCPLFNFYLLRHVSGVPLLRAHAQKVWGADPAWVKYATETPLLLPAALGGQPAGTFGLKRKPV